MQKDHQKLIPGLNKKKCWRTERKSAETAKGPGALLLCEAQLHYKATSNKWHALQQSLILREKKTPTLSSRLYKWRKSQQSSDFCLQINSSFFNDFILFCIFLPYPPLLGTDLTQGSKIFSFRNSGSKFLVQTILM